MDPFLQNKKNRNQLNLIKNTFSFYSNLIQNNFVIKSFLAYQTFLLIFNLRKKRIKKILFYLKIVIKKY